MTTFDGLRKQIAETVSRRLRRFVAARSLPTDRDLRFGLLCGGVAIAVRAPLEVALLRGSLPYVFFFPAVTIAALHRGGFAALTTVLLSVLYIGAATSSLSQAPLWLSFGLFLASSALITVVAVELRRSISELNESAAALHRSDGRLRLLLQESDHRLKNSLAMTFAMVRLTARHSTTLDQFCRSFEPRLKALGSAQALLTLENRDDLDLSLLVDEALAPFRTGPLSGVRVAPGPDYEVSKETAVPMTLLLHELATNATKYGALPEFTVVEGAFGIYVADVVQKMQLCLLGRCEDPGGTRNAVEGLVDWLTRSGELPRLIARAESRRRIVEAIRSEVGS